MIHAVVAPCQVWCAGACALCRMGLCAERGPHVLHLDKYLPAGGCWWDSGLLRGSRARQFTWGAWPVYPESVTTARVPSQGPSAAFGLGAGVGQLAVTRAPWFPKQCLV